MLACCVKLYHIIIGDVLLLLLMLKSDTIDFIYIHFVRIIKWHINTNIALHNVVMRDHDPLSCSNASPINFTGKGEPNTLIKSP